MKPLRLLLVDDDPGIRALLRATFEVVDMEVAEAESAEEAAAHVQRDRPDVVVLDVRMPGKGGLAYCRELKGDPATADIQIVLLTGSDGARDIDWRGCGADAFLLKPFSPLELLAIVERLAGGLYGVPFRATKKRARRSSCSCTPATSGICSRSSGDSGTSCRTPTRRRSLRLRAHSRRKTRGHVRIPSGSSATPSRWRRGSTAR